MSGVGRAEDGRREANCQEVWQEWSRAPLLPVAVFATVGAAVARFGAVPPPWYWGAVVVGLISWWVIRRRERGRRLSPAGLWLATAGLAAAWHYQYREVYAADDISVFADESFQPRRLRGWVVVEPAVQEATPSPLRHMPPLPVTTLLLEVASVETSAGWTAASGRLRVTVEGLLQDIHAGDAVEILGQLSRPPLPDNPGQLDLRALWRDERITAVMRVRHSAATVTRWACGRWSSWPGVMGAIQCWGEEVLRRHLSGRTAGLAAALLLGDTAALERTEWQAYVRTGVVHVLAISGFHLTVLASFIWVLVRAIGLSRRGAALMVAGLIVGYASLTGARAATVRATAMVCAACLALLVRRPLCLANTFALAWLIVLIHKPTDLFTVGCQLSFLSVFMLIWAGGRWLVPSPVSSLEQLRLQASHPFYRGIGWVIAAVVRAYLLSLMMFVALAPLVLYWKNILSPVGILLGPPVMLTSSVALLSGFVTMLASVAGAWAAWGPAVVTEYALAATSGLVHVADGWQIGVTYAPAPGLLWLTGYYLLLVTVVVAPRGYLSRCLAALCVWTMLGLASATVPPTSDELRVTFLAVGHGGCAVLETPDGRVILYDIGSMSGPDITARIVAPYLWHRGIRRIDEIFLSHADMDHFNGLPDLLSMFAVGQISWTPTFADRHTAGVHYVLEAVERRGIPVRIVAAGDWFQAGAVTFQVLHPPLQGPPGSENTRSLVLLVRYAQQQVVLTGDLEGMGQELVQRWSVGPVAVLMAPHHGGKTANAALPIEGDWAPAAPLARWAQPRLVVSCQRAQPTDHLRAAYPHAVVWDTARRGAITVRLHTSGVTAEAFRTGEKMVVARPALPSVRQVPRSGS